MSATIDELLAALPQPPDMALDLTANVITPPEDYDYPEKWDDVMLKWTEFASRIAAWQTYLQGVAGIAVGAAQTVVADAQAQLGQLLSATQQARNAAEQAAAGSAEGVRTELDDLLTQMQTHSSTLLSAIAAANLPVISAEQENGTMIMGADNYQVVFPLYRPPAF